MATAVAPVRIARVAAGGDGVGRLEDGRAVFVPRAAPGDLVALEDVRLHGRFARARVGAVLEPGPGRVPPACPHYEGDRCGGCQLHHLAADAQRAARAGIVGDALRRLARLDRPDPPLEPAADDWGYRTRVTLHAGPDGRIGFHRHDRPGQRFDLARCLLMRPELDRAWQAVRAERARLPRRLDTLTLRLERGGRVHLLVRGASPEAWSGGRALADAVVRRGVELTVWWQPPEGAARVVAGGGSAFPATVFEQVHPAMGDRVRAFAVEALGDVAGRGAWDLYAGIGETSAALAARGARVESVELDAAAVRLAEEGGPPAPAVRRLAGPAERLVGRLAVPDVVVTNPPRAGMDAAVTAAIAASPARRVAYVSCDPATLARDLVRLAPAFRVADVRAFDLFPQTAHVETVAVLERA